jgi:hypothetical protein
MRKNIVAACMLLTGTFCYSQTVNFSPALTASGYTYFTNDQQNPTVLQRINDYQCALGGAIHTPALHISTTPVTTTAFTFLPGYAYTLQIQGIATSTGNIVQPPDVIAFAIALGQPQTTTDINTALRICPASGAMESYAGSVNALCFGYYSTDDLFGTWLTGFSANAAIGNNPTGGFSGVTQPFYTGSPTNQLTIEVAPTLGQLPTDAEQTIITNCGCNNTRPMDQTNTVLTINSIIINQTLINYPTAQINGGPWYFFSSSQTSGSGTITGNPGSTVYLKVTAGGGGGGTYTSQLTVSGVLLSNNDGSVTVTNSSTTVSVVMPPSGMLNWTGSFQETASDGGGSINVSYTSF